VTPDPFLEVVEAVSPGFLREQSPVDLLGGMPADSPDDDPVVFGVPLQNGPGYQTETLADFRGNRDLTLSGEPGLREFHAAIVPR
jgi:hypothetical protein